ncbi:MAG: hypothetical protein OEW31_11115 [Thermoleophilia bacterium]|nr:hypothetical protein [Thermoleophilia bacterium]
MRPYGIVGALVVVALLAPATGSAATLECPSATVAQRLDAADASFVGTIADVRDAGDARLYTFDVDQVVRGELGDEVTVLAPPLVDANGEAVGGDIDVGVFLELEGGTYTTDSCGLVDPSLLLAAADEPRGGAIKLAVGMVILAAVLLLALVRYRRGSRPRLR